MLLRECALELMLASHLRMDLQVVQKATVSRRENAGRIWIEWLRLGGLMRPGQLIVWFGGGSWIALNAVGKIVPIEGAWAGLPQEFEMMADGRRRAKVY